MSYLYLQQKVFSIGEKYTFFDANQQVVFKAQGSFFAIPKRYQLFDKPNNPVINIERKLFSWMPTFNITDPRNGQGMFTVRQRFSFGRPRFDIHTCTGQSYNVTGSFWAYDFQISTATGQQIIIVKKHWLTWGDTYEIWFDTTQVTAEVAAAIVLTIDCTLHSNRS